MRNNRKAAAALALLLPLLLRAVAMVAGAEPVNVSVWGTVQEAESTLPVAGAQVRLTQSGTQKKITAQTDTNGQFRATITEPGLYFAHASLDGYVRGGIKTIQVDADTKAVNVELKVYREAVVSGVVVDGTSRSPVAGVKVEALRVRYIEGELTVMPSGVATTDGNGAFRISSLPPRRVFTGDYVIRYGEDRAWQAAGLYGGQSETEPLLKKSMDQ